VSSATWLFPEFDRVSFAVTNPFLYQIIMMDPIVYKKYVAAMGDTLIQLYVYWHRPL
jgi:hypothetical protein